MCMCGEGGAGWGNEVGQGKRGMRRTRFLDIFAFVAPIGYPRGMFGPPMSYKNLYDWERGQN